MTVAVPAPAQELIPHRPPMRWVDTLLECRDGHAVVEAQAAAEGPLVGDEGRVEAAGFLEVMAQACAAMRGYEDRAAAGPVRTGFLVGVRTLRVHGAARAGDRLHVRVSTVGTLEGFTVAEAEVTRGADVLAAGTLKLWVTDDPPSPRPGLRVAPTAEPSATTLRRAVLGCTLGEVERSAPDAAVGRYRFGPDFLGFRGHFPGYPVLPAVVQVVAATAVAETLLGRRLPLVGLEHAKFRLLVEPGEEVAVECALRPGGDRTEVNARVQVDRGLAADFRLIFGDEETR